MLPARFQPYATSSARRDMSRDASWPSGTKHNAVITKNVTRKPYAARSCPASPASIPKASSSDTGLLSP